MKLEPHPFSAMFPPISDDDFGKLAADIKLHGLRQNIVLYLGKILDGNNRYRACELAGIKPTFTEFTGIDAEARNYVISVNIHRRHLSPDQRREIIAKLLKADPTQSNRQIADTAKVSHVTVGAVRSELEATGQIDQLAATTGKDNKTRKTKSKSKTKKSATEKETIKYQVVVDAITANKAYQLFESYLVDALEQLSEFSSVEHAEEYAEETIEKLQTKLAQLQSVEEEAA